MSDHASTDERAAPGERRDERRDRLTFPGDVAVSKLPAPTLPADANLPPELRTAWTQYMVHGFEQNELMFRTTLDGFMKPYRLTVWLYVLLFAVGIGLFVTAAIVGLVQGDSVVAIAFAGLSVVTFLTFFIRQPLRALEENLELITWLGVAFNTYWTRLMYISDARTVQAELKAADDDFTSSLEKLIERHAKLSAGRTGGKE